MLLYCQVVSQRPASGHRGGPGGLELSRGKGSSTLSLTDAGVGVTINAVFPQRGEGVFAKSMQDVSRFSVSVQSQAGGGRKTNKEAFRPGRTSECARDLYLWARPI